MSHEPYDTLAAAWALGALDGEDRAVFERHLAEGCDVCAAELRASADALATVARSVAPMIPPPEVKEALRRRIAASAPARLDAARPRRLVWAVASLVAVLAGAGFTATFVATRYEARLGQMAREAAALRATVQRDETALREQIVEYQSAVDLLRDPASQVVLLRGLGPNPEANGRVIWHPTAGGHLFVANLPTAPTGKAYELWTIGDGAPRPAGVFQVDASGRGTHRIAPLADGQPVKVFAVTLEPEGGVPAPTGPMVLASAR
jgi:anti-sigma-K factor RskA